MLEENYSIETWIKSVKEVTNPFGDGKSAERIVRIIKEKLGTKAIVQRSLFQTQK
jgi:UDP-N-acetylglucosamine 2-epimerase